MIEITDSTFSTITSRGISVVDFWAAWCQPCKALEQPMEKLAARHKNVGFYKINIDKHQQVAGQFNVQGLPSILIISEGQPVTMLVGSKAAEIAIEKALVQLGV